MTVSREELDRRLDRLVARVEELGERLGVPIRIDEKNTWWLQPRAPAGSSDGGQWTAASGRRRAAEPARPPAAKAALGIGCAPAAIP